MFVSRFFVVFRRLKITSIEIKFIILVKIIIYSFFLTKTTAA